MLAAYWHKAMVKSNPKKEMERVYYATVHRKADIDHPKNLMEKYYWLLLNTNTSLWTLCADKYGLREYVSGLNLDIYLPKLYGVWNRAEEIDFLSLPKEFVLKTNNGCGTNIIIKDKNKISTSEVRKDLSRWLRIPYGYSGAQLHYTKIKPCIIAEELLKPSDEDNVISPQSLIDYKMYCIEGKVECVWIAFNRTKHHVSSDLYDGEWNQIRECFYNTLHYEIDDSISGFKCPDCFEEMKYIAEKLSARFHEVRVDMYVINNKPVIGEMTFTSGYGFFTMDFYDYLGSKMLIGL